MQRSRIPPRSHLDFRLGSHDGPPAEISWIRRGAPAGMKKRPCKNRVLMQKSIKILFLSCTQEDRKTKADKMRYIFGTIHFTMIKIKHVFKQICQSLKKSATCNKNKWHLRLWLWGGRTAFRCYQRRSVVGNDVKRTFKANFEFFFFKQNKN